MASPAPKLPHAQQAPPAATDIQPNNKTGRKRPGRYKRTGRPPGRPRKVKPEVVASTFKLTKKQEALRDLIASDARHILLVGGGRSGKTFLFVRAIVTRALLIPNSRHCIVRFRYNHVRASVWLQTFPAVMRLCFPTVTWEDARSDGYLKFPNGSEIWFAGLDEKERVEKILGMDFCLDPFAKVLTADLRWLPAMAIQPGQEIIGFPEHLDGHTRLKRSVVEARKVLIAPRVRVVTDKGETVVSADHKFVCYCDDRRHRNFRSVSWRAAKDLSPGDMLQFGAKPWDGDETCQRVNPLTLWEGMRLIGTKYVAKVISIEKLEDGPVIALQTSTKTLIADGFLGHNCTIYYNECSQIPFSSFQIMRTRLAQSIPGARLKAFYDLNPVGTGHWTYKLFIRKVDPETSRPLGNPEAFVWDYINPLDNQDNLDPAVIDEYKNMSPRLRRRFFEGVYVAEIDGALWTHEVIEHCKIDLEEVPRSLVRVVVAVDPSGTQGGDETKRSDNVGIVVVGLDSAGIAYVLEDLTCNLPPEGWSRVVSHAYHKWAADRIVAEPNYGGEMVRFVIQAHEPHARVKMVHSSRGKVLRADPISAYYGYEVNGVWKGDRVRHVGDLRELEDQLVNFAMSGYKGERSPDRADALVFGLTELLIKPMLEVRERRRPSPIHIPIYKK
jgi:phage terminase large subunit-like protein